MTAGDTKVATLQKADHEFDASQGVVLEKSKSSKFVVDRDLKDLPLLQRINWLSTTIIFLPLLGLMVGVLFVPLRTPTLILAIVQYVLTGMGITAGYHRLWSHKSYTAALPTQLVLACWGAAAFEGSIRWWCRNHRAHHRYVDTEKVRAALCQSAGSERSSALGRGGSYTLRARQPRRMLTPIAGSAFSCCPHEKGSLRRPQGILVRARRVDGAQAGAQPLRQG